MRVGLLSIAIIPAIIAGVISPSFAAVATPATVATPIVPAATTPAAPVAAAGPVLTLPPSISTADIPPVAPGTTPVATIPPPLPPLPHNNLSNPVAVDNHRNAPNPVANPPHPENTVPLAGTLPPGMRAVSIPAETSSGLVTHMMAGDRVDVLVTHNGQGKPITTEVLMSNAPVLATNVGRDDALANVTVEADNTQVQKLAIAEKVGTLSLALRSTADKDEDDTAKPVSLDGPTVPKVIKHAAKRRVTKTHVAETHAIAPEDGVVKIIRGTGTQESKE